ncbi:MAG: 4Fe-4S binding protein [Lachnospiraceae bacterium]|jgi:ferredoxin|nr:4Fe-4S binding protein [Lachnospiraceae bacterium]
MPRVIGDSCISCGTCASTCPVQAISQGDAHYEINPDTCIDCGACESGCPVGAITEA